MDDENKLRDPREGLSKEDMLISGVPKAERAGLPEDKINGTASLTEEHQFSLFACFIFPHSLF